MIYTIVDVINNEVVAIARENTQAIRIAELFASMNRDSVFHNCDQLGIHVLTVAALTSTSKGVEAWERFMVDISESFHY